MSFLVGETTASNIDKRIMADLKEMFPEKAE